MPSPGRARSSAQRKAASVFPEPVGAWMSVCLPDAIAGQPRSWAGVGASKVCSNQRRTVGLNGASALTVPAYRAGGGLPGRAWAMRWVLVPPTPTLSEIVAPLAGNASERGGLRESVRR